MAANITIVGDENFTAEILKAEKPVLVDFWAPWCGPCLAVGPIVESLAERLGEKVKFAKCNVDDNPVTPGKLGVQAIPTLMLFKAGSVAYRNTGLVPQAKLEADITRHVQA